jgi:hypothetical protein
MTTEPATGHYPEPSNLELKIAWTRNLLDKLISVQLQVETKGRFITVFRNTVNVSNPKLNESNA